MPIARTFRLCRHLFTGGHQCGSPALRGEELCFYHHSTRRPIKQEILHGQTRATLPEPLDLHAVQRGLAELLRLTAAELIDLHLAAQLHRQLISASQNLARIERSEARAQAAAPHRAPVTAYVNHPTLGTIAAELPEAQTSTPPAEVQTQPQTEVHTQPQSNEDFETSVKIMIPDSEPHAIDPVENPLPDPVTRFTLPPHPERVQAEADRVAADRAWAQAMHTLAQGIHDRAKARAQHHAALFPLVDDTLQDRDDLEYDGHLQQLVEDIASQENIAA